jgi:hypothetical protein
MRWPFLRFLTVTQMNLVSARTLRGNVRSSKARLRLVPPLPTTYSTLKQKSRVTSLGLRRGKLRLVNSIADPSVANAVAAVGEFEPMGHGVSICFSRVGANAYTWSLRNDSFVTVTALRFRSSYISLETGQPMHVDGLIPARLEPGQSIGGWELWSVDSYTRPHIQIVAIERIVHRLFRRYRGH